MIIKAAQRKRRFSRAPRTHRLLLVSLAVHGVVIACVLSVVYQVWARPDIVKDVNLWIDDHGYIYSAKTSKLTALTRLPGRWLSRSFTSASVASLVLDMKFKHMQTLQKKRAEALAIGVLVQGDDDYVPASIRLADKAVKVKLRLKGDFTDHLEGNHWSFRVHVKGDEHIFGMRRFSLQHPKVRDYHYESLFFEVLKREGVLVPRYFFVDVVVNGDDYGRMALEEHFSKELLENQDRPESVILKFDESEIWSAADGYQHGFYGVFDNYASARIAPFRSVRVAKSERLTARLHDATGLLRGFVEGHLQASEVFDAELVGRFIAVSEIFGSRHALRWHNLRFYYHPVTARLEPIGFDANIGHPTPAAEVINRRDPIVLRMLSDPRIAAVYREVLLRWSIELADGRKADELRAIETPQLEALSDAFPLLEAFDVDGLVPRTRELMESLDGASGQSYPDYPAVLRAHRLANTEGPVIEIANLLALPVEVVALECAANESEPAVDVALEFPGRFPLKLRPTPKAGLMQFVRLGYRLPEDREVCNLEVTGRILGQRRSYRTPVGESVAALKMPPVQLPTVDALLGQYPFLGWDPERKTVIVPAGRWNLQPDLVIPPGIALRVDAGANLRFPLRGALVAHGPIAMHGTRAAPIVLEGQGGEGWEGLVVLPAGGKSELSHVTIQNTNGVNRRGWRLSSGATFYQSDVRLSDCRFLYNRSEDALNIVRSRFVLENIEVRDALSDGLDSDFSEGVILGGHFESIGAIGGGDAVDVSGGRLELSGVVFREIGDKAISAGEGSVVDATELIIDEVGAGAVSKDGSSLTISESHITRPAVAGLMAYVKKPEFGTGRVTAVHVSISSGVSARVQRGSSISIDGEAVPSEEIDVDALYQGIMKPGLAR